jgi:hypothetical protein
MRPVQDYSIIFSKMYDDFKDTDLRVIAETSAQCISADPDIQEIMNYIECVNQPEPPSYTGI